MEEKENKKLVIIIICLLSCIFLAALVFGVSYYSRLNSKTIEKEEAGGKIVLNYSGSTSGLTIIAADPMLDVDGMKIDNENSYFDFSIDLDNQNSKSFDYEISIKKDTKFSTVADESISFYLEEEKSGSYIGVFGPEHYIPIKEVSDFGTKKGSMILLSDSVSSKVTKKYRLRMWITNDGVAIPGNYSIEVNVEGNNK